MRTKELQEGRALLQEKRCGPTGPKRMGLELEEGTPGWSEGEGQVAGTESRSQEVKFRSRKICWMSSRERVGR